MESNLDVYGRPLPEKQGGYHRPILTADAVVFKTNCCGETDVLLITRKKEPFIGKLAFPGGHIDYNEEPQAGCLRELQEETGLIGNNENCQLLTVAGNPQRDPRGHYVSIVYLVTVPQGSQPKAADDAETASFYPLDEVLNQKDKFAFDHYDILKLASEKLSAKL